MRNTRISIAGWGVRFVLTVGLSAGLVAGVATTADAAPAAPRLAATKVKPRSTLTITAWRNSEANAKIRIRTNARAVKVRLFDQRGVRFDTLRIRVHGSATTDITDRAHRVKAKALANKRLRASQWKAAAVATRSVATPTTAGSGMTALELRVLQLTNQARRTARACGGTRYPAAPALSPNTKLAISARRHSQDMAGRNFFSHTTPDGRSPWDRIGAAGYRYSAAAENIAAGYSTAAAVVQAWIDSPGHCANLMSRQVTELGVGYATGAGRYRTYWTQNFGRPR